MVCLEKKLQIAWTSKSRKNSIRSLEQSRKAPKAMIKTILCKATFSYSKFE